ncbi:ABC transporter permease [Halobacteria archaeon AArc-m2/3/4]|uniref:ABC transporter permease n=1 Tax=Natronoglomus mannanivorans TaxID=2979990 RepID=A0ABT2QFJ3_9EURY|nr:ABC transporter permease [Halobacteria archaeon AArc-m2/3/4]
MVVGGVFSGAYSHLYRRSGRHLLEAGLSGLLFPILAVLVPFVAVMVTSDVIARKRQSGSIKVVLGLPYARLDLVVGSFVGRTALMSGAILSMAIVSGTITAVQIGVEGIHSIVGLFALTMLLSAVFVAIAVGISAASLSPTRASASAVVVSACFVFQFWAIVPYSAEYVRNGFQLPERLPEWGLLWNSVNPVVAYQRAAIGVIPDLAGLPLLSPIPATAPYYFYPEFAVAVLFGWILLSLSRPRVSPFPEF